MKQVKHSLERGQAAVEYGLLLVFIAVTLLLIINVLGDTIQNSFFTVLCEMRNMGRSEVNCILDETGTFSWEDVIDNTGQPIPRFDPECTGLQCTFYGLDNPFKTGEILTTDTLDDGVTPGTIEEYWWVFDVNDTNATDPYRAADGVGGNDVSDPFTYDEAGTYFAILTVQDNDGNRQSSARLVTVSADGDPPYANFEYYCPGATCAFFPTLPPSNPSRASSGASLVEYRWDFGDLSGTTSPTEDRVSHPYQINKDYDVTLTVEDDRGLTDSITRRITITGSSAINELPVARFIVTSCEARTCTFDASASSDDDGVVIRYDWDFTGSGYVDSSDNPIYEHEFATYGSKTVRLRVADNYTPEAYGIEEYTFDIDAVNNPPHAQINSSYCNAISNICSFSSSGTDPDGDSIQYQWDMSYDLTTFNVEYTTQNVNHLYDSEGTYYVALRTYDGAAYSPIVYVIMTTEINDPPVINSVTCDDSNDPIVSCSASVTDEYPGTLTYSWDMGDTNIITSSSVFHTYSADGSFDITLTVTDNAAQTDDTLSSPESVTIANASGGGGPSSYTVTITPTSCGNTADYTCDIGYTTDPVSTVITSCDWDFSFTGLDGQSTDCNPNTGDGFVTFPGSGLYTVTLTTIDDTTTPRLATEQVRVHGFYIASMDAVAYDSGNKWYTEITVTVLDEMGNGVSGLNIHGDFSNGSNNAECAAPTDVNGVCVISSGDITDSKTSTIFAMDQLISGGSIPYDYALNTISGTTDQGTTDGLATLSITCPASGTCD